MPLHAGFYSSLRLPQYFYCIIYSHLSVCKLCAGAVCVRRTGRIYTIRAYSGLRALLRLRRVPRAQPAGNAVAGPFRHQDGKGHPAHLPAHRRHNGAVAAFRHDRLYHLPRARPVRRTRDAARGLPSVRAYLLPDRHRLRHCGDNGRDMCRACRRDGHSRRLYRRRRPLRFILRRPLLSNVHQRPARQLAHRHGYLPQPWRDGENVARALLRLCRALRAAWPRSARQL